MQHVHGETEAEAEGAKQLIKLKAPPTNRKGEKKLSQGGDRKHYPNVAGGRAATRSQQQAARHHISLAG
jgi:hypothetical protein